MSDQIMVMDYSSDWYLNERYVHPKRESGPYSREEIVELYGSLGVAGIELLHAYWYDCSPQQLRKLTADAGLPIVSYIFPADLAQPAAARRPVIDQVFALLDRTAELGAVLAMMHPALVKEDLPLEQQQVWLIEGLRQCAERAQSIGLTIIAENIDDPQMRPLMGRGADCRDICAAVDSPAFRLIYDVGAPLFVEEDPLETLRVMAPYIAHVHVKNNRPLAPGEQTERYRDSAGGRRYTGTVLDGGIVELRPILAELDRLKYDGYICIEYQGEDDPRTALPHSVAYLRQLLNSLK
ncbi:MAG: sugar phosphate isomerase/epimerase [Anaerolineales bacterium]|nr:sugar phosphate isomerase/epimerase [Anaerolineales bacterium]